MATPTPRTRPPRFYPDMLWRLPGVVQIETTNHCNLSCVMCAQADEEIAHYLNRRHLELEQFRSLLDQFPGCRHVVFQGVGEPLLNPQLIPMIKHSSERGLSGELVSNGTLLDEAACHSLLESGLTRLDISIDSADPKIYEGIRRGASFSRMLENVERLLTLARQRKAGGPEIWCRTVVTRFNVEQIPALLRLMAELGMPHVLLTGVKTIPGDEHKIRAAPGQLEVLQETVADFNLNQEHTHAHLAYFAWQREEHFICPWPWQGSFISVEGYVTPCCYLSSPHIFHLGNAFEEPFHRIWNNDGYRSLRRELLRGTPKICLGCEYVGG